MVYNHHFTDQETEAQKANTASQGQRWDSNPVLYKMLSRVASLPLGVVPGASYNGGHRRFLLLGLGDSKVLLNVQSVRSK